MKLAATLVSSLALVLCAFPAQAQMNSAPAPDGSRLPLFALACQDAQGRSLPPGSANCVAGRAQSVSGTVTSNQGAPNAGGATAWFVQWANQSVAVSSLPSLPAGTNVIGAVTQSGGPWSVSGTVAATQSGTWTVGLGAGSAAVGTVGVTSLPAIPAGSNAIGSVSVSNFPGSQTVTNGGSFAVQNTAAVVGGNSTAVKTDGSATTQPISASSLPLPAGAATSANQTSEIAQLTAANAHSTFSFDFNGTSVGANATVVGAIHNLGASPNPYAFISFNGSATVSGGTFYVQGSADNFGNTVQTIGTANISTASTSPSSPSTVASIINDRVRFQYYRVVYLNGGTAGSVTGAWTATTN